MQTGVISFCDRVGHNIKSNESKDVILRTLEACFKIKIIQRQWHRLEEESLVHLQRSPHLLCLRSNGNPYYMYFTRYDDVPQIFFIDKKIQPGYYYPRIILGKGMFDEALFDNTLLDGEMVKNNDKKWVFLVNDVIAYKGRHLENMGLVQRLALAFAMFEESYNQHNVCDLCLFRVKKYFPASSQGLDDMMALADKLNYTNRGLYFWPTNLRYKPKLHNFDDTLIKTVNHKIKDNAEFRSLSSNATQPQPLLPANTQFVKQTPVPFVKPVPMPAPAPSPAPSPPQSSVQLAKPGESTMWLRKTEHPDVYDVFRTDNGQGKLGTTYIQSLATSKKIRDVFKELTLAVSVPFKCVFNEKFQKWAPCI